MKPEDSLPCSQNCAIGYCPKPEKFYPNPPIPLLYYQIYNYPTIYAELFEAVFFIQTFPQKSLSTFFFYLVRAAWPANLILLNFDMLIISVEVYT
jgi:hypothetical protein